MDSFLRHAPRASIKAIDARVRVRLNSTTDWLESQEDQASLISFALKQGKQARARNARVEERLKARIAERQREKKQQLQMKDLRKCERNVLEKLKTGCVAELTENLDDDQQRLFENFLSGNLDFSFRHVWATDDGTDDIYLGTV